MRASKPLRKKSRLDHLDQSAKHLSELKELNLLIKGILILEYNLLFMSPSPDDLSQLLDKLDEVILHLKRRYN